MTGAKGEMKIVSNWMTKKEDGLMSWKAGVFLDQWQNNSAMKPTENSLLMLVKEDINGKYRDYWSDIAFSVLHHEVGKKCFKWEKNK